jgi:hypothetical protein
MKAQKSSRHAPEIRASRTNAITQRVNLRSIDTSKLKAVAFGKFPAAQNYAVFEFQRRASKRGKPKRPYVYAPVPVTKATRALALQLFPRLGETPAYGRFLTYLIVGDYRDTVTDKILISREVLAVLVGRAGDTNFRAGEFLSEVQEAVFGVGCFGYRKTWVFKKKPRYVEYFVLPEPLQAAIDAEDFTCGAGKVCLCDGTAFNELKQRSLRERRRDEALKATNEVKSDVAELALHYLNKLPHHIFSKIPRKLASARELVSAIEVLRSRRQAEAYLRGVMTEPQPFYRPSQGEGDRVFGISGSLPFLGKAIRKALAPEWHEADLKHAQLAICAWHWKIEKLQSFLANGGDAWAELVGHMQIPPRLAKEGKSALKRPLYSACYGMSPDNLADKVDTAMQPLGIEGGGKRFLRFWIIEEIIEARKGMTKQVRKDGGMRNCFGRFISLRDGWRPSKNPAKKGTVGKSRHKDRAIDPHQILAMVAQAQELQLLEPAFRLAVERPKDFTICLFQHDGFSVRFLRREKKWRDLIKAEVDGVAMGKGIETRLEWD